MNKLLKSFTIVGLISILFVVGVTNVFATDNIDEGILTENSGDIGPSTQDFKVIQSNETKSINENKSTNNSKYASNGIITYNTTNEYSNLTVRYMNVYKNGSYIMKLYENGVQIGTIYGVCLNHNKNGPMWAYNFNLSNNTSSVDSRVKELVVRYFREDMTPHEGLSMRYAIWKIMDNNYNIRPEYYTDVMNMIGSLTGLNIGDKYTYIENGVEYIFDFYYGTPFNFDGDYLSDVQHMLLFNYTTNGTANNTTNQTPSIGSNASEKGTGSKNPIANGTITIVDTISYYDLVVGKNYTLKGILMDKII